MFRAVVMTVLVALLTVYLLHDGRFLEKPLRWIWLASVSGLAVMAWIEQRRRSRG